MTDSTVWIKAYSADGFPLAFTVSLDLSADIGLQANAFLNSIRGAGFSAREAGIVAGEQVETLAKFSIRMQKNQNGSKSPIIDLFADASHKKRHMGVYLNTPEEIAEFESLVGYRIADCKINIGKNSAQADDDATMDTIYTSRKPARYVWKDNPKYDKSKEFNQQAEPNTPARLFVRWMPDTATSTPPVDTGMPQKAQSLFEQRRSLAVENAVANEVTFTVREIVVGASGKQSYLDFSQPLTDDGKPGITARYWGKTGQRLEGLKDAIGTSEWSQLGTPGTVRLEFPVEVTAKREGQYWSAVKVASQDINF